MKKRKIIPPTTAVAGDDEEGDSSAVANQTSEEENKTPSIGESQSTNCKNGAFVIDMERFPIRESRVKRLDSKSNWADPKYTTLFHYESQRDQWTGTAFLSACRLSQSSNGTPIPESTKGAASTAQRRSGTKWNWRHLRQLLPQSMIASGSKNKPGNEILSAATSPTSTLPSIQFPVFLSKLCSTEYFYPIMPIYNLCRWLHPSHRLQFFLRPAPPPLSTGSSLSLASVPRCTGSPTASKAPALMIRVLDSAHRLIQTLVICPLQYQR